jgi:hypothetical protein
MPHHVYADDTQILAKTPIQSLGTCCHDLETCIMAVQRWCAARRLKLNPDETEIIRFRSAVQLQYLRAANAIINATGVDIKLVDYRRNLGVYIENRLDMRVHISKIASV